MLVKMRPDATPDEVAAVEAKVHGLGFKTGKMVGEEITRAIESPPHQDVA